MRKMVTHITKLPKTSHYYAQINNKIASLILMEVLNAFMVIVILVTGFILKLTKTQKINLNTTNKNCYEISF